MLLNPKIWLPKYMFIMKYISINYPKSPNDVTKKKYYDFIQNLPLFFPNEPLGNNLIKMLDKFPVTPYLESRLSFMKWVHFTNNKLRETIEHTKLSFSESLEFFYEEFKTDRTKKRELYLQRKKFIQIGVLIGGIGLIFYLYNK